MNRAPFSSFFSIVPNVFSDGLLRHKTFIFASAVGHWLINQERSPRRTKPLLRSCCILPSCSMPTFAAATRSATTAAAVEEPDDLEQAHSTEKQPLLLGKSSSSGLEEGKKSYDDDHYDDESVWGDVRDTVVLGIPIFLAMLSWVGMKTTDSALLGHVSAQALAAAALSDLWTMCSGVFLQGPVLGILCGAAVGAGNPKLAGIYLQVSLVVLAGVVALVFALWWITGPVWRTLGQESELATMAGTYARLLAWSLPGQLLFGQLSQFFSAQRIMHPEVMASSLALALNLLLGLIFVLGIPIPNFDGFGFVACPLVTTTVVYLQVFVFWYVFIHLQRLHEPCWGGWIWKEITLDRIRTFADLYVPAALGLSSDFWRVAVIGGMTARLGELDVAIFNTSYRIMWMVMILVNAVSSAAGIKMTIRLGKMNPLKAQQAGEVGIAMVVAVLVLIGGVLAWKIRLVGSIFTGDPEFLDLLEDSKWPFTLTLVLMNLSVALERIPYSMGRTKEVFWYGFIASWGGQVPAVALSIKYWRADLVGVYTGMGTCVD